MRVAVLAGGLGTRLRAAVFDRPKPLALVGGRPFLEHLLDFWIGKGATSFVLSVGYMGDMIRAHFGNAYRGCSISYAMEEMPLGTGGGVALALSQMDFKTDRSPVWIVNGDSFFAIDVGAMLAFHEKRGADITLALRQLAHNDRYGAVETDADGFVLRFSSAPSHAAGTINGGIYLFGAGMAGALAMRAGAKLSLETDIFPEAMRDGKRLAGFASDAPFVDIGVPEDYRLAEQVLAAIRP